MNSLELHEQINSKQAELNCLIEQYHSAIETEKAQVLKSKSKGLTKTLYLLGFRFESSSSRTPQYLEFHRTFKRELTAILKPLCKNIEISKPNHFDFTGFFELHDGRIFYISMSDLRFFKGDILLRTAKHFRDFTGGSNYNLILNEDFENKLVEFIK